MGDIGYDFLSQGLLWCVHLLLRVAKNWDISSSFEFSLMRSRSCPPISALAQRLVDSLGVDQNDKVLGEMTTYCGILALGNQPTNQPTKQPSQVLNPL